MRWCWTLLGAGLLCSPGAPLEAQNRSYEWDGSKLVVSQIGEIISFERTGFEAWAAVEPGGTPMLLADLLAKVPAVVRQRISMKWQPVGYKTDFVRGKLKPSTFTFRAEREPDLTVKTLLTWSLPEVITIRQSAAASRSPLEIDRAPAPRLLVTDPWNRDCRDGCGLNSDCSCFCSGSRNCPLFPFAPPASAAAGKAPPPPPPVWVIRLRPAQ